MLNSQLFAKCGYLWPSSFLSCLPVRTFHSRTLLSFCENPPLQEASMVPSNENRTPLIWALWPSSFLSSLPLSTSHRRIVLSSDPLTSCDGFVGLKWTQLTSSLPLSQLSALLVTALRLSPAERGRRSANPC